MTMKSRRSICPSYPLVSSIFHQPRKKKVYAVKLAVHLMKSSLFHGQRKGSLLSSATRAFSPRDILYYFSPSHGCVKRVLGPSSQPKFEDVSSTKTVFYLRSIQLGEKHKDGARQLDFEHLPDISAMIS